MIANYPKRHDPLPHERRYFRNQTSGNLGWLVRRDGKDMIRLDRLDETIVPYDNDWAPEEQKAALTDFQVAQVAYAADERLGYFTGRQKRRDWSLLTDEERIAFTEKGPAGDLREKLYNAIKEVFRAATAGDAESQQPSQ